MRTRNTGRNISSERENRNEGRRSNLPYRDPFKPNTENRNRRYYNRFYDRDSDIYESEFARDDQERYGSRRSHSGRVHGISHYEDPRNNVHYRYEDFDDVFYEDDYYNDRDERENYFEDDYRRSPSSERDSLRNERGSQRNERSPIRNERRNIRSSRDNGNENFSDEEEYDYTYDPYYRNDESDYEYANEYGRSKQHAPMDEDEDAHWDYSPRSRNLRGRLRDRVHSDTFNGLYGGYDY